MEPRSAVSVVLALAAGVAVLSGCTLRGDLTVNPDTTITVDVLVTHSTDRRSGACRDLDDLTEFGVRGELVDGETGRLACRYTGTLQQSPEIAYIFGFIGRGEGRYIVTIPTGVTDAGPDQLEAIDLAVTFPGPVLEAPGSTSIQGNTVRWADAAAVRGTGILVVALDHPAVPPAWMLAAVAGGTGAAAGAAAVWLWGRRRSGGTPSPAVPVSDDAGADWRTPPPPQAGPTPPPAPVPPEDDPRMWARPD